MKIRLKRPFSVLGKGVVDVNPTLARGLIRRGQAEPVDDKLNDMSLKELQEKAKEKDIPYSGKKKADLLKELKENISTKEDKEAYKTK